MLQNPIAISLSPNTENDDVLLAFKTLFQPWKWLSGPEIKKVEGWFEKYFQADHAYSFNSGRSAFYSILKSFDIKAGDEVLVQAFTCVAAIEPILWVGARPIYVDVDKSLNLDPNDLEKKITKKTKAIVAQHTFGIPAEMDKIIKFAKKHNLILIEDCAHVLGASYKGKKLGTFGQAAYFSFGRDKVVSSVFGGISIINEKLIINNEQSQIKMKKERSFLSYPKDTWIFQQLLHPILFAVILPFYNFFNLGKILLVIFQKLKLLSFPVYKEERQAEIPTIFPKKLPNGLAILALNQLNKLEKFNQKKTRIAKIYTEQLKDFSLARRGLTRRGLARMGEAVYLRYPILVENPAEVYQKAKKQGMLLGRWYSNIIDPAGVDLEKAGYKKGSCKNAEKIASKILNLPTYPRLLESDVEKIIKIIKKYAN